MNKKSGFVTKRINGEVVNFKFGTNAFALFCETKEISMADGERRLGEEGMQIGDIRDLIWSGAASWCRLNNKEENFNRYTVGEWLDEELSDEDLTDILQAFSNSKIMGRTMNVTQKKEEEKKSID